MPQCVKGRCNIGYFANGTEGEMYEERYCERCIHSAHGKTQCPILELHLLYNYDQCAKTPQGKLLANILGTLIPRDGVRNLECKMFVPEKP